MGGGGYELALHGVCGCTACALRGMCVSTAWGVYMQLGAIGWAGYYMQLRRDRTPDLTHVRGRTYPLGYRYMVIIGGGGGGTKVACGLILKRTCTK